jgi:hypothetical protein
MHDQSCNLRTLSAVMRWGDFHRVPLHVRDLFREQTAKAAEIIASSGELKASSIKKFHLKKKASYRMSTLASELVVRKVARNVRRAAYVPMPGRAKIVKNLARLLEEGVPYKVYRLDIKSFYESFHLPQVQMEILSFRKLAPESKRLLGLLLDSYAEIGGQGLPRGMALSADLANFLMRRFDEWARAHPSIYFYARYVDDIIFISNISEIETDFVRELESQLPVGLSLNKKKTQIYCVREKTKVQKGQEKDKPAQRKLMLALDYLGYNFSVFDPPASSSARADGCRRSVEVDIASTKLDKIKKRVVRAFLDFYEKKDPELLIERIRYLTSNFYIIDKNTGARQLSGIYYGYPALDSSAKGLKELDKFLRNAVLSKRGRLFSRVFPLLSHNVKRALLAQSFEHGHIEKRFSYFSLKKIGEIQSCWKYE